MGCLGLLPAYPILPLEVAGTIAEYLGTAHIMPPTKLSAKLSKESPVTKRLGIFYRRERNEISR